MRNKQKLKQLPEIKTGKPRRHPSSMHNSGSHARPAAALLVEPHVNRVAVLEPDLVRRLRGSYVAATGVQEPDGLGAERVLALEHVHEPPQLQGALDAEEHVLGELAVHLDVDEVAAVPASLGLHRRRGRLRLLLNPGPCIRRR